MFDVLAPTHLLLILIVALLVLGPKRLPEVGKTLGKGIRDFKDAMTTYHPENFLNADEVPAPRTPPVAPIVPAHADVHEEPLITPITAENRVHHTTETLVADPPDAEVVPSEPVEHHAG